MTTRPEILIPARIGLGLSVILFAVPALALWLSTTVLLSGLIARGWQPLTAWFAAGGLVFAGLLAAAVIVGAMAARRILPGAIAEQLRLRPMSGRDWRVSIVALVVAVALTSMMYICNATVWPQLPSHPVFMQIEALKPTQFYLLALWMPFFALNIIGEELWWRGFIQTRQEPVFGPATWVLQGLLHLAFHASFGPGIMFVLLPVVFVIPWAVQRTGNTSVGMFLHAAINGPAFLAVALGLLPSGL
jgi:membrane protease YdiL (CAAX protease family)